MAGMSSFLMGAYALQAGGGFLNAYNQSKALKEEGDYQRQIYESNARMADLGADDTLRRGGTDSAREIGKARRLVASQRAAAAGQGVNVDTGSVADLQDEAYSGGQLDALTIKNNAWREAWGYRTQAEDYRFKGKFAQMAKRREAKATLATGGLQAVRDLATGAYFSSQYGSGTKIPRKKGRAPYSDYGSPAV